MAKTIDVRQITNEAQLEDLLSTPYPEDIEFAKEIDGEVIVLGAGGKMGPSLVRRIVHATRSAHVSVNVYAVSRFSDFVQKQNVEGSGAVTISADLLRDDQLMRLPECPNVIYMAGTKFGSTGKESLTWAMNSYLPGRIAERFRSSRIVAFSTGNVYPLVPINSGGSRETDRTDPIGEYAQSCLGRERVLNYFSNMNSTPMCILRLNYAVEPRYGVVLDIANKVFFGQRVSVSMGYVNIIWQGDANSVAFRSLGICESPPRVLNITGVETLSVRALAEEFARRFGRNAMIEDVENDTALLNDASRCCELLGPPKVSTEEIIDLIAHWVMLGGPTLNKPTKFEVRNGKF